MYSVTYAFLSRIATVRAGYKRGVVRPEVLCHAHNHGGQIQTLKKKLHKLNTNAQYTIVAMSQTTVSTVFTIGDILATLFFRRTSLLRDRMAILRVIRLAIGSPVLTGTWAARRRRKTTSFSIWRLKVAFGCPGEFSWLSASGIRRSTFSRRSLA